MRPGSEVSETMPSAARGRNTLVPVVGSPWMSYAKSNPASRSVRTAPPPTEKPLAVVIGVSVSDPTVSVSTTFSMVGSGRLSSSLQAAATDNARSGRRRRIVGIER
jgi:hypothetical protein